MILLPLAYITYLGTIRFIHFLVKCELLFRVAALIMIVLGFATPVILCLVSPWEEVKKFPHIFFIGLFFVVIGSYLFVWDKRQGRK